MSALDKLFGGILSAVSPTYEANRPIDLGTVETQLSDEQKKLIGQEKNTGLAGLNINKEEVIPVKLVDESQVRKKNISIEKPEENIVEEVDTTKQSYLGIPNIINLDLQNNKALGQFNKFFKQNKISNDYIQSQLNVLKNDIGKLEGNDPKGFHEDGAKGKYQWLTGNDVKKGEKFPKNHFMYKRGERIAKEYYPDSFQTALNRAKKYYSDKIPNWIIQAEKHKDPRKLSESQQDELFFMDILQRKNSSKLIKNYLENPNDKSIFQKVYNVWHSKALGPNMGKYIEDMLPKYKKQSGGMIESDPYKRQPRFI